MKSLVAIVIVFAIMIGSLNSDNYKKCVDEKKKTCDIMDNDCYEDAKVDCEIEYF